MNGKEIIKVKNIVNSYTEWDLLEEVIVGKIEGSYAAMAPFNGSCDSGSKSISF